MMAMDTLDEPALSKNVIVVKKIGGSGEESYKENTRFFPQTGIIFFNEP